jgi:hypothetical protein
MNGFFKLRKKKKDIKAKIHANIANARGISKNDNNDMSVLWHLWDGSKN